MGAEILALAFWVMVSCIPVHGNRCDVIRILFKELGRDVHWRSVFKTVMNLWGGP